MKNTEDLVIMTPEKFKGMYNIDARVNNEVIAIDRENKEIEVKNLLNGSTYKESYDKLLVEWLTVEEAQLALKKEYIEKFKKIIPSVAVIRYFQIENRLQILREVQTSSKIPLASPNTNVESME